MESNYRGGTLPRGPKNLFELWRFRVIEVRIIEIRIIEVRIIEVIIERLLYLP